MNKKASLLMGIVLTTILALSIVPSAFAGTWIYYDDGPPANGSDSNSIGGYLAVRFSLPSGCSQAQLLTARFYKVENYATYVKVHILGSDGVTELTTPLTFDIATPNAWNDADLTSKNIVVTGDFYVAIEYLTNDAPMIGADTTAPIDGRSYSGTPGSWGTALAYDLMIRAEIECSAVGGVVYSPDKLGLLSPLLIVTGLIGAIVIGSFVVKKRRT